MESCAEPKLCVNCAYIGTNHSRDTATYRCFAPANAAKINLVDGTKIYTTPFCTDHRTYDGGGTEFCGSVAIWFIPKLVLEPVSAQITSASAASTNPDDPFYLPPLDNNALAAKLAAARSGSKQAQSQTKIKPATNLLEELGL